MKRLTNTASSCPQTQDRSSHLCITPHSILITRSPLQILLKSLRYLQNTGEVGHGQRLGFVEGECLSSAGGVLDLSAIEVVFGKGVEVGFFELGHLGTFDFTDSVDEHFPDTAFGFGGEFAVFQGDVDTCVRVLVSSTKEMHAREKEMNIRD